MDYQKHYSALIEKGQNRSSLMGLIERHHIIPRCMGGSDNIDNLVELTPEEHFVAHQLLVKIYPKNRKLILALSGMCTNSCKNPRNNKWYGWIRRKMSSASAGENNPSAKFTNEQVIEIYHSTENMDILAERYGVARYNIITIKRKIYYKSVTWNIDVLPGFCIDDLGSGKSLPIPQDFIEKIFYDTGDYSYFWEKYRATCGVVKGIKSKRSFKSITSKLGTPGQVKRYGLTQDMVEEVFNAIGTNSEIAKKYNIHYNTVRNIKSKYSRAFNLWEEF